MLKRALPLILTLCWGAGAQANQGAVRRARAAFVEAEAHFAAKRFAKALGRYRAAYASKPLAGFLFNIGQCNFNLGRFKEAIFYYQRYLSEKPRAPNRAAVRSLIRQAKKKARETKPVRSPGPAETPSTASQPAGGDNGGSAVPTKSQPQPETAVKPVPREPKGAMERVVPPVPRAMKGPFSDVGLWVGLGSAAGLALVGGVFGAVTLSKHSEYRDPTTPLARQQELRDSGRTTGGVSGVLLVSSVVAALATAGYYYFFLRPRLAIETPEQKRASLSPHGTGIRWSF